MPEGGGAKRAATTPARAPRQTASQPSGPPAAAPAEGSLAEDGPDRGRSGKTSSGQAGPDRRGSGKGGPGKSGPGKGGPGKSGSGKGGSGRGGSDQGDSGRAGPDQGGSAQSGSGKGGSGRGGSDQGDSGRAGPDQGGSAQSGSGKGGSGRGGSDQGDSGRAGPDQGGSGRGGSPDAGGPDRGGRIGVRKTYKLYIGGAFPRSESGRSYPVTGPGGAVLANAAWASRKDVRDAVVAARAAVGRWSGATAYNRGQVLYRVAELLEGRRPQFAAEIVQNEGLDLDAADDQVARAIDRMVWYAGWTDKISQIAGAANPVAGPYFNFSVPEPAGVIAVIAPPGSSLLGLVSVVAPVIATGNTAVVVASEARPLPAVTLTEVLATSDLPGGVVNLLTGRTAELVPVLAAHMDVNAIDLSGVPGPDRAEFERLAAQNVKRVFAADEDWAGPPGLRRLLAFLETKTVWHPVGI